MHSENLSLGGVLPCVLPGVYTAVPGTGTRFVVKYSQRTSTLHATSMCTSIPVYDEQAAHKDCIVPKSQRLLRMKKEDRRSTTNILGACGIRCSRAPETEGHQL